MRGSQYRRSEGKTEQKIRFCDTQCVVRSFRQKFSNLYHVVQTFLQGTSTVAVKTLKESASEKERKDLLQVAKTALTSIFVGNLPTEMPLLHCHRRHRHRHDHHHYLQELEVMKMLKTHPNVVRLIGCCTQGPEKGGEEYSQVFKLIKLLIIFKSEPIAAPIYVIMEFVAKGKLQEFLRKSRAEHYYGNLYG